MIVALAGGVGASRFLQGLIRSYSDEEIRVIVNTGDDIELYGLHISPDIDIITYSLAGIVDESKGWGIKGDSFNCIKMLQKFGIDAWFNIGDMDLATNIFRTNLLKGGLTLTECTERLCRVFGVRTKIIPMSNDKIETRIVTDKGDMHFQEYLVKRSAKDKVLKIVFRGIEKAKPAPKTIESIEDAELIIICPSNPLVSIRTILSIKGFEEALMMTKSKIVSITPIIGCSPVKGPLDRMMSGLGLEVSAYTIAKMYRKFVDAFILDEKDKSLLDRIENLGIKVYLMDTLMKGIDKKIQVAKNVLRIAKEI